ncbi:unnamed protein product [Cuscuta epithymum]|nr:unnamed protein product [Cuscuta epithymum]
MDAKSLALLKKQMAKEAKKKVGPPSQKAVDEFFQKPGASKDKDAEGPSKGDADAQVGAGGSKIEELKRKNTGKGVMPPEKKKKKGGEGRKEAPILIAEDQPSSHPPANTPPRSPPSPFDEEIRPAEIVQFPIKSGTSVLHGTLHPVGFMRGVMSSKDKSVLARFEDDILDYKVASYTTMAALAASEQVRRVEQLRIAKGQADEALKKSDEEISALRKRLADAEEALRLEKEGVEQRLRDAEAKGKASAEEAAAEAAKAAAIKAEEARKEAALQAERDAVSAFVAGGWQAEERKPWVDSVVEASVDAWVRGPGAMWLARKGKEYYDGGEFFTQWLVYRRLARHLGVDPKEFDPSTHGLPPLQPDTRVPLPPGVERPDLEDSELMKEAGDDEDAEDDAVSKREGDVAQEVQP